jgi:hypothetical protein
VKPLQIKHPHTIVDRSSELRNSPNELEKLWEKGKIIHLARQKFLVKSDRPKLLTAGEIKELSGTFIPGLRIFLGMLDGEAFFAFCTDVKRDQIEKFDKPTEELVGSEFENYKTLRETDGLFNESVARPLRQLMAGLFVSVILAVANISRELIPQLLFYCEIEQIE